MMLSSTAFPIPPARGLLFAARGTGPDPHHGSGLRPTRAAPTLHRLLHCLCQSFQEKGCRSRLPFSKSSLFALHLLFATTHIYKDLVSTAVLLYLPTTGHQKEDKGKQPFPHTFFFFFPSSSSSLRLQKVSLGFNFVLCNVLSCFVFIPSEFTHFFCRNKMS